MARAEPRTQGDLPDVNVWLALLNAQHPYHQTAKHYWEHSAAQHIAFCRITMLGLLRLSTNKVVMGGTPYTTEQAWQAYETVTHLPEVGFASEPTGIEIAMQKYTRGAQFRQADWTDTYLAAFAQLAGLRMVSFDKGFARYSDLPQLVL
jgi:toxin-antitoxin system PIN domain toxin